MAGSKSQGANLPMDGSAIALVPHPGNSPGDYAVSVAVEQAADGRWLLSYHVAGDLSAIVLPPPRAAERADGLWQESCFELFARRADGSYCEWNFAPSGCWAVYEFSSYRTPVSPPPATLPPAIALNTGRDILCRVAVDVWPVTGAQPLCVGLSAIIERTSGERDFWALAHPAGQPDFHAPPCFARQVSPPG